MKKRTKFLITLGLSLIFIGTGLLIVTSQIQHSLASPTGSGGAPPDGYNPWTWYWAYVSTKYRTSSGSGNGQTSKLLVDQVGLKAPKVTFKDFVPDGAKADDKPLKRIQGKGVATFNLEFTNVSDKALDGLQVQFRYPSYIKELAVADPKLGDIVPQAKTDIPGVVWNIDANHQTNGSTLKAEVTLKVPDSIPIESLSFDVVGVDTANKYNQQFLNKLKTDIWDRVSGKITTVYQESLPFAPVGFDANTKPVAIEDDNGSKDIATDKDGKFTFLFNRTETFKDSKKHDTQFEVAYTNDRVYITDAGEKQEDTLFFRTVPQAYDPAKSNDFPIKMSFTNQELANEPGQEPHQVVTNTSEPAWDYPTDPEAVRLTLVGADVFHNLTLAHQFTDEQLGVKTARFNAVLTPYSGQNLAPWSYSLGNTIHLATFETVLTPNKRSPDTEFHEYGHQVYGTLMKQAGFSDTQWFNSGYHQALVDQYLKYHNVKVPANLYANDHGGYASDLTNQDFNEGFATFMDAYFQIVINHKTNWMAYGVTNLDWITPIFGNATVPQLRVQGGEEEYSYASMFKGLVDGAKTLGTFPWINPDFLPADMSKLTIQPLASDDVSATKQLFSLLNAAAKYEGAEPSVSSFLNVLAFQHLGYTPNTGSTAGQNENVKQLQQYFGSWDDGANKPSYLPIQALALRYGIFTDTNCDLTFNNRSELIGVPANASSGFIKRDVIGSDSDSDVDQYKYDLSYKTDDLAWPAAIAQQKQWDRASQSTGQITRHATVINISANPVYKNITIGDRPWRLKTPPDQGSFIVYHFTQNGHSVSAIGQTATITYEFASPNQGFNTVIHEQLTGNELALRIPPAVYPGRVVISVDGSSADPVVIDLADYRTISSSDQPPVNLAEKTVALDGGQATIPPPVFKPVDGVIAEADFSQAPTTPNAGASIVTSGGTSQPTTAPSQSAPGTTSTSGATQLGQNTTTSTTGSSSINPLSTTGLAVLPQPGDTVTVQLTGFTQSQTVQVLFDKKPIAQQPIVSDTSIKVTIPQGTLAGQHTIEIVGSAGKRAEITLSTRATPLTSHQKQAIIIIGLIILLLFVAVIHRGWRAKALLTAILLAFFSLSAMAKADVTPAHRDDFIRLPESQWYGRKASTDDDYNNQWGRIQTVCFAERLGYTSWNRSTTTTPTQWIVYGDFSRPQGGPFPPHSLHQEGRSIDLYPIFNPGSLMTINYADLKKTFPAMRYTLSDFTTIQQKLKASIGNQRDYLSSPLDNPFPPEQGGTAISELLNDPSSQPFYSKAEAKAFVQQIHSVARDFYRSDAKANQVVIYFAPLGGTAEAKELGVTYDSEHKDHWHIELPSM